MKKLFYSFLLLSFSLALFACSAQAKPALALVPAQLTAQEKDIAALLGTGAFGEQALYDFTLDDTAQSLSVNTYRLVDGAWEPVSNGARAFSGKKGRLALGFDNIAQGLRIGLQGKQENGATSYTTNTQEDFTSMGCATSFLSELTEITYEQEIPLVVQIATTKSEINSYDVQTYFTPEQYAQHDYEHVYAITIQFSQKSPDALNAA